MNSTLRWHYPNAINTTEGHSLLTESSFSNLTSRTTHPCIVHWFIHILVIGFDYAYRIWSCMSILRAVEQLATWMVICLSGMPCEKHMHHVHFDLHWMAQIVWCTHYCLPNSKCHVHLDQLDFFNLSFLWWSSRL